MSEKIVLTFLPDGSLEVQDEPGQNAEQRLKFLLNGIGEIVKRGHRSSHSHTESLTIRAGKRE